MRSRRPHPSSPSGTRFNGQALVLFALFLLVLLGASALAIDYANWLLTDRRLQNNADHAALAGASAFQQNFSQAACLSTPTQPDCLNARAQAWASLDQDVDRGPGLPGLNLDDAAIACLSTQDTPQAGWTNANQAGAGCGNYPFGHRIWVVTPPPNNVSYTGVGGAYANNNGTVFVRVDEPTRSYLAGALGFGASDPDCASGSGIRCRIGWATAGPLPTDFAFQVFCRNGIPPQSGACGGSGATSLVIDGQGGIRLLRGDIGSNESLKVTATNGGGVVTKTGNVFLVNGSCSNALWRCPNGPPSLGGISDGTNGKNPFLMPPQPVPQFQSPLSDVTVTDKDCTGANSTNLCVPYRPWASGPVNSPGDWSCDPSGTFGSNNLCGIPVVSGSDIRCDADVPAGITPSTHLVPSKDLSVNGTNGWAVNTTKLLYTNINDDPTPTPPEGDAVKPPPATPTDYMYLQNVLNVGAGGAKSFEVALRPPFGRPQSGFSYIRFVTFKTNGANPAQPDPTGNQVDLKIELRVAGTTIRTITESNIPGTPTRYDETTDLNLQIGLPTTTNFNALSLKFTFSSPSGSLKRGGAIAWAEVQTPTLDPALPPMIPPGYYHSVTIPAGGCAVMDPTAQYYGYTYPALAQYQKAGIYRFGGGADAEINVGAGSYLIGDGVTLVFDPDFPDPTGGRGIVIGSSGALVLNTMRVPGVPPCTPTETETTAYNPSQPLYDPLHTPFSLDYGLPYSSVCAAWAVDGSTSSGLHPGTMLWTADDPANPGTSVPYCADPTAAQCISRARYGAAPLPAHYRGITFYFSTNNWPATTIRSRFQMNGGGTCTGSEPGIAFRGVLYAPYDDVKITGSSAFNTVGQVLAWTAKFNGACATIDLDYPYEPLPAAPYLLEPRIGT